MGQGDDYRRIIEALLYVVQFQRDPVGAVSHALKHTLESGVAGDAARYLTAVRAALASDDRLADIIPQDHPEAVVRAFLRAVEARLLERAGGGPGGAAG